MKNILGEIFWWILAGIGFIIVNVVNLYTKIKK